MSINPAEADLPIEWRREFLIVDALWRDGKHAWAAQCLREWGHDQRSAGAPESVQHQRRVLAAAITLSDPDWQAVMALTEAAIRTEPGVLQSALGGRLEIDADEFRWALYRAAELGVVHREKSGRSYALSLPDTPPVFEPWIPPATAPLIAANQARARERLAQMEGIKQLMPFWQLAGPCVAPAERLTRRAGDARWDTDPTPWRCGQLLCRCEVYAMSAYTMEKYVEAGCSPGDEAAAALYQNFIDEEHAMTDPTEPPKPAPAAHADHMEEMRDMVGEPLPPHVSAASTVPPHIRQSLRRYATHAPLLCLDCGYEGLAGISSIKRRWGVAVTMALMGLLLIAWGWLSGVLLVSTIIGPALLGVAIVLPNFTARPLRVCPNCGMDEAANMAAHPSFFERDWLGVGQWKGWRWLGLANAPLWAKTAISAAFYGGAIIYMIRKWIVGL